MASERWRVTEAMERMSAPPSAAVTATRLPKTNGPAKGRAVDLFYNNKVQALALRASMHLPPFMYMNSPLQPPLA
jgi:hypothetical protein